MLVFMGCGKVTNDYKNKTGERPPLALQDYDALMKLSDSDMGKKLAVGEMGNCTARALRPERTCDDGKAYQVYLLDFSQYYPSLQKDPDDRDSVCLTLAGRNARFALRDGYCFTVR